MGKQTQTGTTNSQSAPWAVQQPYLQQAFNAASGAFGQSTAAQNSNQPSGFTAQYTPAMMQAFQQELGYGTGNGSIPASSAAAGSALNTAGANAATQGLYGLANFTPQGGTQSNIDAANQYVAGQNIPAQVKAAMLSGNQEYQDVTAPQIDRASAGTGNINSSTNAIQQGLVQRGLAQQAQGLSAQLQGSAYNQGLGLAEQNSQMRNAAMLQALQGAAGGGTGAVNSGTYANSGSVGQQSGLFNIANTGASNINAGNQAGLTNQLQAYNFGVNSPFAALNNFYNIVGNKSWGGTTTGTSTQTSTPSTMSMISSGIGMLGSLF